MFYRNRIGSAALKTQIAGALKGKAALIAFYKLAILVTIDGQLDPVAAFNLEGGVIPSGGMLTVDLRAFGDDGSRNRQFGGVIVFSPLAYTLGDNKYKETDEQNKENCKNNTKESEIAEIPARRSVIHGNNPFLLIPV